MPGSIDLAEGIRQVWTSDIGSMAQETAVSRWPKTVQNIADDVRRHAVIAGGDMQAEAPVIVDAVLAMGEDILKDRPLQQLPADAKNDLAGWNETLATVGDQWTWRASPWLFSECYLYRRVQNILTTSNCWQEYDVFKQQKDSTFAQSRVAVEELAARYMAVVKDSYLASRKPVYDEMQKLLFVEMTQIALWGNATDLSLLGFLSLEQIQGLQGREAIARNRRNIVDDDTEQVWRYLVNPCRENRRIDIVLDNSGFEFFTDVVYASSLLRGGLADFIVLHVKSFPWFVSDVTPSDVDLLFSHLESPAIFPDRSSLDALVAILRGHFSSGAMTVRTNSFWTTGQTFHDMEAVAPGLYKSLKSSALVVFKGDLNYRKLTKDGLWPHTTPFNEAIGCLGVGSGIKVLALRTNKADVCVGIEDQARVDALNMEAPNGAWVRNGKYAVISFSDGT